jgi:hypothetical protein
MPLWNEVLVILNEEPLFKKNTIVEKTVIDEKNYSFKIRSTIKDNLFFKFVFDKSMMISDIHINYFLINQSCVGIIPRTSQDLKIFLIISMMKQAIHNLAI